MLSKLAKIANRLDSLGLTKEADVLDAFIRKVAADASGSSSEYKRFEQTLGSLNRSGLVSYIYNNKLSQTKDNIIAAGYYLGLSSDSSNFNNIGPYDTKAVNAILSNMTNAINALGGKKTYNTASEFFTAFAIPEDAFESAVQAGISDAENIIASREPAQSPAAAPAAPPAAAATVSAPTTGWEKYISKAGALGPKVKQAWTSYSQSGISNANPSFLSFTSWYNGNLKSSWGGKHKSPSEVIKLLNSDDEKSWQASMANPWGSGSGTDSGEQATSREPYANPWNINAPRLGLK